MGTPLLQGFSHPVLEALQLQDSRDSRPSFARSSFPLLICWRLFLYSSAAAGYEGGAPCARPPHHAFLHPLLLQASPTFPNSSPAPSSSPSLAPMQPPLPPPLANGTSSSSITSPSSNPSGSSPARSSSPSPATPLPPPLAFALGLALLLRLMGGHHHDGRNGETGEKHLGDARNCPSQAGCARVGHRDCETAKECQNEAAFMLLLMPGRLWFGFWVFP